MSVLQLKELSVFDGPFEVVHGVSFEISSGDVVALIGPNGSGKASLLRGALGLVPTRGSIAVDGVDMASMAIHERVRLGVVLCPADRALFPKMSVRENLLMGAFLRRDGEVVERDLDLLRSRLPRLDERWKLQAGQLSGGEQRLLAVAKALMARPRFLLLTEPTEGLAPAFRAAVEELVRSGLDGTPPGVLLVDQDLDLNLRMASRFLAFRRGKLVAEMSLAETPNPSELRQRLETFR